jgi:hypothetical protein
MEMAIVVVVLNPKTFTLKMAITRYVEEFKMLMVAKTLYVLQLKSTAPIHAI